MSKLTEQDVPTPAVIIDLPTVQRNIRRMAEYVRQHRLHLRPHTKTHKLARLAGMQLQAGAVGLTVAKVGEARVMADVCDDLLLAYPALDPARTRPLAELAQGRRLRVAVDSAYAADQIASAARHVGVTIGILVDVDVGLHRTGLQSPEQTLQLAQHVQATRGLSLDGLFCYPGFINLPSDQQPPDLRAVAARLQACLDLWKTHGLEAPVVSGGSTPTAFQSHLIPQQTEIRPGTYIYYDRNCLAGGWCSPDDCAARVLSTVVSTAVPDHCVLDAGNKSLAMDLLLGRPTREGGHGLIVEFPEAVLNQMSEEHGRADVSRCAGRPKLGQRVHVIPNHICPCINLQNFVYLKDADGGLEKAPVDARGLLS